MPNPHPVIQINDQVVPFSQLREMIFSVESGSGPYGSYVKIMSNDRVTLANLRIPNRFPNVSGTLVENAGDVVGYLLKLIGQLSSYGYWFSLTSDKDRLVLTEQGDKVAHAFKLVENGINDDGVLKLAFIDDAKGGDAKN